MVATICDWRIDLFLLVLLRAGSTMAFVPAVAGIRSQQTIRIVGGVPSTPQHFAVTSRYEFALLFDCDGVILETEELHRLAYNEAFKKFDLSIDGKPVEWSVRVAFQHPSILLLASG